MGLSERARRLSHPDGTKATADEPHRLAPPPDRTHATRHRPPHRRLTPCRLSRLFCAGLALVVVFFFALGAWQQSGLGSAGAGVYGRGGSVRDGLNGARRSVGSVLRFYPSDLLRKFELQGGLDQLRSQPRFGVRPPRLALVIGSMHRDPQTLMLLSIVKSLQELGYVFSIFALEDGEAHHLWENICCRVPILDSKDSSTVDWTNYEGVILSSLEAKKVISSLMKEPFTFVPLLWLVHEDTLGKHLPVYLSSGWKDLISDWQSAFKRADAVVFQDFSLPMLYTSLDTGNFYVIPGSPLDVWVAKSYMASHSRQQLRKDEGYNEDDFIILVIGSYFFYDELQMDYASLMVALAPQILNSAEGKELGGTLKFVFLCGNSTDSYSSGFQELASRMGFPVGSVRQYGMDSDVNSVLLIADVVLYASFQEEQTFPPLLLRAMSFGVPFIAPDSATIRKHVINQKLGFLFHAGDSRTLGKAFSLVIADKKLSRLAQIVASYGKLYSMNMLASDCIVGFAKLLENVIHFPSDAALPDSASQIHQSNWLWNLFENDIGQTSIFENLTLSEESLNIVHSLEEELAGKSHTRNISEGNVETFAQDYLTQLDWDDIRDMEVSEDFERRELQELEERTEKNLGSWEEVYHNARKAEKQKPDTHERDEGELERTGQTLCIYEVYSGEGAWPFLHHGSLYRGLTLTRGAQRSRTDDVDAVGRLPILSDTYYRDLLCELGGMFSIANKIDNIHKIPWIGFQSWRATGKKVALSIKAEKVLEEYIQAGNTGDVIYFWALMDMDIRYEGRNMDLDFWSVCDIFNGGNCRVVFEEAFRHMYGLSNNTAALPPMPSNGGQWSALHCWVMPTPSFLDFIMFSRMFIDSLHSLLHNTSMPTSCVLGSSKLQKRQCYCRVMEVLVNIWAYHSARKMVYLNPYSGEVEEQHPIAERVGLMWAKYLDPSLLRSMDEDLAEEADDNLYDKAERIWSLTGEVHWQGILDKEREDRYRKKMDKKRKNKEKLLERQKHGYKQKALGR